MRVFIVSASAPVTRTLTDIIAASGHTLAPAAEAELLLIDPLHPAPLPAVAAPPFTLEAPHAPHALARQLAAWRGAQHWTLASGWQLDLSARALTHASHPALSLTEKETELLAALAVAQPGALARDALLARVWGMRSEIDTHTLETHIYRLRSKLEAAPSLPCDIATEDGHYRLVFA